MPRWLRWKPRRAVERLLILARFPQPGRAKTRLIPTLGAAPAARLHTEMVWHTLAWADDLARLTAVQVEIHFAGGDEARMRAQFGSNRYYREQVGEELGARMVHACEVAFGAGAQRVVIVGTDCPDLSAERASEAFRALTTHDVVLGPALDGGYYLIGLSQPRPSLFSGIDWGTERVLAQTVAAAQCEHLSIAQLERLADVDVPQDLPTWERARTATRSGTISIIIPTLNEGANLAATLAAIRRGVSPYGDVELIVVDGGSRDDTVEIATEGGAQVITSEPGRARQMNKGSVTARGEILLFLHADTRLPTDFDLEIHASLVDPAVVVGAFRLGIDGSGIGLRLVERMANWRARWRGLPYGDQALFIPRWIFRTVGGFPELDLMEDFALVDALRRRGLVALAKSSVCTSARRWQRLGVARTTLVNQMLIAGYRLGVSPQRLAAWYRNSGKQV